jgi:mycothiol S-conjugate amidase
MHVHAHPDDESSKGAASTAKYVAEGVDVHVVTCTGGERGSILNPKMDRRTSPPTSPRSAARRWSGRATSSASARTGWASSTRLARGRPQPPLPEGCFALVPLEEATERLVRFMRDFKPHVSRRTTRRAATRTPTTSAATR